MRSRADIEAEIGRLALQLEEVNKKLLLVRKLICNLSNPKSVVDSKEAAWKDAVSAYHQLNGEDDKSFGSLAEYYTMTVIAKEEKYSVIVSNMGMWKEKFDNEYKRAVLLEEEWRLKAKNINYMIQELRAELLTAI